MRLGFHLDVKLVLGQVVRQADGLRFGQHRRHAEHHLLGADAGFAEGTLESDANGFDIDHVAIGNGITVQQFAGTFLQPIVVLATAHGQLDYLNAGRPDVNADRRTAQQPRQDASPQGDPLTVELALAWLL